MSELVIVATDLYFAAGSLVAAAPNARLPGLARMARFGTAEPLPHGWRSWLAAWLGLPQLTQAAPAPIAALAAPRLLEPLGAASQAAQGTAQPASVWLADPLNLTPTLTSVHLSARGLLRIDATAQQELAQAFNGAFAAVGYGLRAVRAGRFLATGPALCGRIDTTDPARYLGSTLSEALPRGEGAAGLRRLAGELEMWLHEHPINARRAGAGRAPISTLWLWGGGAPLRAELNRNAQPTIAVFSDDAYVEGLSHLAGVRCAPAPPDLAALGARREPRIVATLELFTTGESQGAAPAAPTPLSSLEALDREWLLPALEQLAHGMRTHIALLANDRCISLAARDRWRLWRRPRQGLAVLAPPMRRAAP
ncbi:MAG TPA: hypothetical protein VMD49_00665 [Steroidobacteraceae bacterium]|nr:hypothetical protein [Steroidobacteraceae bacterium]